MAVMGYTVYYTIRNSAISTITVEGYAQKESEERLIRRKGKRVQALTRQPPAWYQPPTPPQPHPQSRPTAFSTQNRHSRHAAGHLRVQHCPAAHLWLPEHLGGLPHRGDHVARRPRALLHPQDGGHLRPLVWLHRRRQERHPWRGPYGCGRRRGGNRRGMKGRGARGGGEVDECPTPRPSLRQTCFELNRAGGRFGSTGRLLGNCRWPRVLHAHVDHRRL